jgi:hypothetical protein
MVNVIAIYWFLGALLTLRWAWVHPDTPGRAVAFAASIAGIIASAVITSRGVLSDLLSDQAMLALVGAFSIAIGLLRVSGVFRESVSQAVRRSRPEVMVLGGLEIALGIVLVLSVEMRPVVVPMLGIWGLVGGSIMLADAIRAWRVLHRPPVESVVQGSPEVGPNG